MNKIKSFVEEKIKNDTHLLTNFVFAFFPISFILGSFAVNSNLLLFCGLGIYYLKSKILRTKLDWFIKIIFLFFFVVFLSTSLSFFQSLYFQDDSSMSLTRFTKSMLFFRFFLLLITIYYLHQANILKFKYFFITTTFATIFVSLDIIFQYIFGFNTIGLQGHWYNTGFFGNEVIAGGYLQRFSFFAIFFTILTFNNKNYFKFISTSIVVCILGSAILFSGNRMPLIIFIFGLFFILLFDLKIRKIFLTSLVVFLVILNFLISSNDTNKMRLGNFYSDAKGILYVFTEKVFPKLIKDNKNSIVKKDSSTESEKSDSLKFRHQSFHERIFLTAIDTWKFNRILGNGIKAFRFDCLKLKEIPGIYMEEDLFPDKKNRLCSQHPHNYYLEVLTETGIVGSIIVLIIAFSFIFFIFKSIKFIKKINFENFILLSAIISLTLETLPLKSTGSLFTTNNATYLILIGSIILCYRKNFKTKR